jgi:hypothetical protein
MSEISIPPSARMMIKIVKQISLHAVWEDKRIGILSKLD